MRQKTITLYQIDELPTERAKEKARQWYREASAGDTFWSEHTCRRTRHDGTGSARLLRICEKRLMRDNSHGPTERYFASWAYCGPHPGELEYLGLSHWVRTTPSPYSGRIRENYTPWPVRRYRK